MSDSDEISLPRKRPAQDLEDQESGRKAPQLSGSEDSYEASHQSEDEEVSLDSESDLGEEDFDKEAYERFKREEEAQEAQQEPTAEEQEDATGTAKLQKLFVYDKSAEYAKYRPTYPPALIDRILFLTEERGTCLDIATGTGQLAIPLAQYFKTLHAFDSSETQIENAEARENITYTIGDAHDLSAFKDIDCITVGQAMHWFDFPTFFDQVKQTLKPNGTLAVAGYQKPEKLLCNRNAYDVNNLFFEYWTKIRPWFEDQRKYVDNAFEGVDFPFAERNKWIIPHEMKQPVDSFLGYLSTWSGYKTYRKQLKEGDTDILVELGEKLRSL